MFVSRKKSKIISIRISPEEHELLKNAYAASGRRSVSALAREAMQRILSEANAKVNPSDGIDERLRDLDVRLSLLQRDVSQISYLVAQGGAVGKKETPGQ